eukprot:gb/GECH01012868.1/.p1 GENE.gb/GECH01012868.1/~~gb/GECH01012868.1/.p1  ORF type:complete len:748 (+),score=100.20 gb/GECH01012868.1/:1-2244(+)
MGRGGKLRIPPKFTNSRTSNGISDKWKTLENAIRQIYEENASSLSFQVLYTSAYQMVLHDHGNKLYHGVEETINEYVVGMCKKVQSKYDNVFLEELLQQWDKHVKSVTMIRDILMYMDKNFVKKEQKSQIFDLGVKLFGKELFTRNTSILNRTMSLMLDIVRREREGEIPPDRFLLKKLTDMMLEISRVRPELYNSHFEREFLEQSQRFYRQEAAAFFSKSTAPDYLNKVKQRLQEEKDRAQRSLARETLSKLQDVVKKSMIEEYKELVIDKENSGVLCMLQDWKVNELRLVFEVLGLVDNGLQPVVQTLRSFCKSEGFELVKDDGMNNKPLDMVSHILDLKDRYDDLLVRAFSTYEKGDVIRHSEFATAVRRAFEDIVNENDRFPEYLSLFVDSKLKKGKEQVSEHEYEIIFEKIISLFKHMREKDVFEKYYKTHLGKRLLSGRSASDEAERSFITKLKSEFGYQFTAKLEGMFKDMRLSKETMQGFKQYLTSSSDRPPFDLSVQVLTTGYWPVNSSPPVNCPYDVQQATEIFRRFYTNTHSGRQISWQYNMGTADVRANGFQKPYELNVSTYQMIILLAFNNSPSITYGELLNTTQIPVNDMKRSLLSLTARSKNITSPVLVKDSKSKLSELHSDTVFKANEGFKSRLIKVKVAPVILKEAEDQKEETMKKVNEDRKWQIDATIVRVMKSRKVMEHRDLVLETTKLLQQRFMPSPDHIKRRIESLIEREYVERDINNRNCYKYLA